MDPRLFLGVRQTVGKGWHCREPTRQRGGRGGVACKGLEPSRKLQKHMFITALYHYTVLAVLLLPHHGGILIVSYSYQKARSKTVKLQKKQNGPVLLIAAAKVTTSWTRQQQQDCTVARLAGSLGPLGWKPGPAMINCCTANALGAEPKCLLRTARQAPPHSTRQ